MIESLQANGASVCFVGDGMNDAIALKKAHVSVSMRGASTIAADAASILLLDGNLSQLGHLFELADGLRSNLRGDLVAAVVPGVICIGSVLFLQVGVGMATMISFAGFGIGITNCMMPLWTERAFWNRKVAKSFLEPQRRKVRQENLKCFGLKT